MFESLKTLFSGSDKEQKKQYLNAVPKLGVITLLLFVAMPSVSYFMNLSTTANWYIVSTEQPSLLIFTASVIIIFIWIFVYFLHSSNMRILLRQECSSSELSAEEIVKRRIISVNLSSLVLTLFFFIQLWFYNHNINSGERTIALFGVLLLWIAMFLAIGKIRTAFYLGSEKLKRLFKDAGRSVLGDKRINEMLEIVVELEDSGNKFEDNDLLSYALNQHIERRVTGKYNNDSLRAAYIKFTKELGLWSFTITVVAILLLVLTRPSGSLHDGLPVIFFLTLLSFVLLFLWNLVFRKDITIPTFKVIALYWKDIFLNLYRFWRVFKTRILITLTTVSIAVIGIALLINNRPNLEKHDTSETELSTPEYKRSTPFDPSKPIIVVTASGGGIAASAWTAAVLRKLEKVNPDLVNNIIAVSGVSGGALGGYYFVAKELLIAKCAEHFSLKKSDCRPEINYALEGGEKKIMAKINSNDLSARSSLGAVAWGAAAYELASVTPLFSKGRDDALKERWQNSNCKEEHRSLFEKGMKAKLGQTSEDNRFDLCREYNQILKGKISEWETSRLGVSNLLVNTTQQSTGLRTVLSSDENFPNQKLSLDSILRDRKISSLNSEIYNSKNCIGITPMVEAIKHSATFPYVTAATQITASNLLECSNLKNEWFIDGGYIDNHGTSSALEYIEQFSTKWEASTQMNKPTIILLNLNAYPSRAKNISKSVITESRLGREILSPIFGLAGIRGNQSHANESDIFRAQEQFNIIQLEITFDKEKPLPLSWHLSKNQQGKIEQSLRLNSRDHQYPPSTPKLLEKCKTEMGRSNKEREIHGRMTAIYQVACVREIFNKNLIFSDIPDPDDRTTITLEKQLGSIIRENNLLIKKVSNFTENIELAPQWAQRMMPDFCEYTNKPTMVAISPIFKKDESTSDTQPSFHLECLNDETKSCADTIEEDFIHIIGLASNEGTVVKNLLLAEKRVNWLNQKLLKQGIPSSQLLSHPIGEGAYLPYPYERNPSQKSRSDPGHLNRYSLAFYCKKTG